jgi:hypothetical protein
MAIDTAQRRASATHIALAMFGPVILPDGTLNQADRQSAAMLYPGILAGEAGPVADLAKHRGFLRNVGRLLSG